MGIRLIINKIWQGDIHLAWAFWGVGLCGLAIPVGLIFFWPMILTVFFCCSHSFNTILIILFFLFWFVLFCVFCVFPSIVIWRSASKTSSELWGFLTKAAYMVITILVGVIIAPIVYVYQDITWRLTPEFYENTAELRQEAPSFFKKHTGLDIPVGAKLVHVAYNRDAVLDYEANHHVILDASGMDLKKWISTAKPFGKNLQKIRPRRDLEWNADGLKCEERSNKEPKAENIIPICRIFGQGQGTFTWVDGNKYVGEYKDGKRNGQGTYTYASGSKYVGEYKDGKANGQGTYTWADGDKYVGEFKDGKANGQGTYTFASGRIEEGIFKDDKFLYAQKVTPREVWQVEKRLRLDWLVTLTVLEEEKLIWLLEANW